MSGLDWAATLFADQNAHNMFSDVTHACQAMRRAAGNHGADAGELRRREEAMTIAVAMSATFGSHAPTKAGIVPANAGAIGL